MSRLGDLIRTERIRQKMTPKQVARKCGVSESYLVAVEAGTRIIADDQARRILKAIGLKQQTEAEFTLDDIAATVDLAQVQPRLAEAVKKPPKKEAELAASSEDEGVAGSVWLDALQSVLKRVPVMNAVMKPVAYKLVPVENGRIEGANPDKVFYYLAPDDSMRGFRIHKGDIVLTVPAQSPVDGAIMLMNYKEHRYLRKVKVLDDRQVLLQSYDREYEAETVPISEIGFLSRCVQVTFELQS
uniref:Transcriptional regulator, XRE family n=1 Tax=uncultured bacterium Contigcl_8 TaxID=1393678 RepID=W0FKT3_9BACT|nr:transcriptional regulator, XRE family [uncultured bacterium Contigcl_8]